MKDITKGRVVATGAPSHPGWDAYWAANARGSRRVYSAAASLYRRVFICTRLAWWLRSQFPANARLLHAGCGSGEVDALVQRRYRITALDISPHALLRYDNNNPYAEDLIHADLMDLGKVGVRFDGVYSLGVLELFTADDIAVILANMKQILNPGGKIVAFWPLASAVSVKVLGLWHRVLNRDGGQPVELHPPELTLIDTRSQVEGIVAAAGLNLSTFAVSLWDLRIQAVIVCK